MRRVFEFFVAFVGIVILSPALLTIATLVMAHDGGSVFYRARRVGRNGRFFGLYKFRTMIPNADKEGGALTVSGDIRVTPIGRFLRRHKLDELPQLLNVLKGDMSLVGPRPEDPRYIKYYSPEQRRVLTISPGITSPASLRFRNEEALLSGQDWEKKYLEEILPRKLALELEYFPGRSFWRDIRIIIRTLGGKPGWSSD